MAYIKEPKGVDMIIQSEPLTDEARQEISSFIKAYKKKKASDVKRSQKPAKIADTQTIKN